ncbi:MAG: hypothetical protein DRH26_16020 [Deltaproteobacteria bacterium]|nr:MAG: hypothetical protein DRH26_16020 [Deltaproteobacteria bacterium]
MSYRDFDNCFQNMDFMAVGSFLKISLYIYKVSFQIIVQQNRILLSGYCLKYYFFGFFKPEILNITVGGKANLAVEIACPLARFLNVQLLC